MKAERGHGVALRDYIQMVWERRWIILLLMVLMTGLSVAILPRSAPVFQATALLRIRSLDITASGEETVRAVDPSGSSALEVEAARSHEVADETVAELGHGNEEGLLDRLSVSSQPGSSLLRLTLMGHSPSVTSELRAYVGNYLRLRAREDRERINQALGEVDDRIAEVESGLGKLSNRLAREREAESGASPETSTKYAAVSELYRTYAGLREQLQLDAALAGNSVELVGSPTAERLPVQASERLRFFVGPLVGFLLGCAIAVGLGVLRPRVGMREQVEDRLGYPVLATIPHMKADGLERNQVEPQQVSRSAAEGVRVLRTELQLIEERGAKAGVILVASPQPLDGRSTVAANLAASYAAVGRRAVLVRPSREEARGDPNPQPARNTGALSARQDGSGFAEVPLGPMQMRWESQASAGGPASTIRTLADSYEIVIIDTFPLLASADTLLLASESDVVVLVLRQGRTLEDNAVEALDLLARHQVPVIGIVLNDVRVGRAARYRYDRGYDASRGVMTEGVASPPPDRSAASPVGRS